MATGAARVPSASTRRTVTAARNAESERTVKHEHPSEAEIAVKVRAQALREAAQWCAKDGIGVPDEYDEPERWKCYQAIRSLPGFDADQTVHYTPMQLKAMIDGMHAASDAFYKHAVRVGNHAFIEFTGFMNEYIKLCEDALARGVDFTRANVHSGAELVPMQTYHADYIGEKFGCIFASSFAGRGELIQAFISAAFGVDPEQLTATESK